MVKIDVQILIHGVLCVGVAVILDPLQVGVPVDPSFVQPSVPAATFGAVYVEELGDLLSVCCSPIRLQSFGLQVGER